MRRVLVLMLAVCAMMAISARAADSSKLNGWISDSMCGAKHAGTGSECVKKCIAGGEKPVFVDEAKKEVWTIENPDAVKDFYGAHVTVTASADAARKTVHIDSIAELK